MRWIYRHPKTRLVLGYTLHGLTLVPPVFLGTYLFETSFLLYVAKWSLLGMVLTSPFLRLDYKFNLQPKTKRDTKNFDSTPIGKKVSLIIKNICKKNGLPIPERKYEKGVVRNAYASANRFLVRQIFIYDQMYNAIKDNTHTKKEMEHLMAHELGHIYHLHTDAIFKSITRLQFAFFYLSLGISVLIALEFGINLLLFSTSLKDLSSYLMLLGVCQISNIILGTSKFLSGITEMIIARAMETQAELKACEFTSPKLGYQVNLNYASRCEKSKDKSKDNSYISAITHYYRSLYDTHPTWTQNALDIAEQFPEVKSGHKLLR